MPAEGSSLGDSRPQRGHSQDDPYMVSLGSNSYPRAQQVTMLRTIPLCPGHWPYGTQVDTGASLRPSHPGAWAIRPIMCCREARPRVREQESGVAVRGDRQLTVSLPGQVLYKLAWSESMERDCATFCAKK